jgi:Flp pilus assembly protein CpaB
MSSIKEDRQMQTVQVPPKAPRPPKRPRIDFRKMVSTRRGSVLVAGGTALLAALVLMVFLAQYKRSLNLDDKPVTVLVARTLIEKGSPGTLIAQKSIFQTARVPKKDLKAGAIADPANLTGKVAKADVYPGQQLVASNWVPATSRVHDEIIGNERAISLPLDNSHGMIGDVQGGDHVDVFYAAGATGAGTAGFAAGGSRATLVTLTRNLLVLRAPKAAKQSAVGGANTQQVVLRATDDQAAKLAFASDNGKIWLVLRPKVGATDGKTAVLDQRAVLLSALRSALPAGNSR